MHISGAFVVDPDTPTTSYPLYFTPTMDGNPGIAAHGFVNGWPRAFAYNPQTLVVDGRITATVDAAEIDGDGLFHIRITDTDGTVRYGYLYGADLGRGVPPSPPPAPPSQPCPYKRNFLHRSEGHDCAIMTKATELTT